MTTSLSQLSKILAAIGYHGAFILMAFTLSLCGSALYIKLHSSGITIEMRDIPIYESSPYLTLAPEHPTSIPIIILAWLLVFIVFIYTTHVIGMLSSRIFKHILSRQKHKTHAKLFLLKTGITTIWPCICTLLTLFDSSIGRLLPIVLALYFTAVSCFSIQHYIYARLNIKYAQVR